MVGTKKTFHKFYNVKHCSLKGCRNNTSTAGLKLFYMPHNKIKFLRWCRRIPNVQKTKSFLRYEANEDAANAAKNICICKFHFEEESFTNPIEKTKLKANAMPSKFYGCDVGPEIEALFSKPIMPTSEGDLCEYSNANVESNADNDSVESNADERDVDVQMFDTGDNDDNDSVDDNSSYNFSGDDDSSDYVPDVDGVDSEDEELTQNEEDALLEEKLIVHMSALSKLMQRCPECGEFISSTTKIKVGFGLIFKLNCISGHVISWESMPLTDNKRRPEDNGLIVASMALEGKTYHDLIPWKRYGLVTPCKSVYNDIERSIVYPAINLEYDEHKENIIGELSNAEDRTIGLSGDSALDSPGSCANIGMGILLDSSRVQFDVDGRPTECNSGTGYVVAFDIRHRADTNHNR